MPNHYFQFKEFRIEQDKCALKVCTDSCLFGAWIEVDKSVNSILDIGTGTGLLSLMLAQKTNAQIDGIEIDENAYLQTKENFNNSNWKDRLNVFLGDVNDFHVKTQYDFIICNPPFYENELASASKGEKIAKHSMHLTLPFLLTSLKRLLNDDGKFALLLPYYRKEELLLLAAKYGFFPIKTLYIKQTPEHDFFRFAAVFSNAADKVVEHHEFPIKQNSLNYSATAQELLRPYYLYL